MMQQSAVGDLYSPDDSMLFTLDENNDSVSFNARPLSSRVHTTATIASTPRSRQSSSSSLPNIGKSLDAPRTERPTIEPLSLKSLSLSVPEVDQYDQAGVSVNPGSLPPLSPGVQRILDSLEAFSPATNKTEVRLKAAEKVTEQAYSRCLSDLEAKARAAEELRSLNEFQRLQWLEEEERKKEAMRAKANDLKSFLDGQSAEAQRRRLEEKGAIKNAVAAFILPETQHEAAIRHDREMREQQKKIAYDLLSQSQQKMERKGQLRAEEIMEEREYLDHVSMEMDIDAMAERLANLEKQRVLLQAWEKDAHLTNLRKMKSNGGSVVMKEYARANLPPETLKQTSLNTGAAAANTTVGALSTFRNPGLTVGYDTRAKK
jgi:hypothetical protein